MIFHNGNRIRTLTLLNLGWYLAIFKHINVSCALTTNPMKKGIMTGINLSVFATALPLATTIVINHTIKKKDTSTMTTKTKMTMRRLLLLKSHQRFHVVSVVTLVSCVIEN
jgi:hypothetical protein